MDIYQRLKGMGTYSSTYPKAQRLERTGGVLTCEAEKGDIEGTWHLNGLVRASEPGKSYRANVSLALDEDDVVDFDCTCPMGSGALMCKHQIALALHFLNGGAARVTARPGAGAGAGSAGAGSAGTGSATGGHGRGGAGVDNSYSSRSRSSSYGAYGRRGSASTYAPPTSSQIKDLITNINARRAEEAARPRGTAATRAAAGEASEPVELLASIAPANTYATGSRVGTWLLKLRIRRGKVAYVVKNMADLVRSCAARQEYTYGKRLSFVHAPEVFDARSRAIIALVTRIVRSQQALYYSRDRYWDAGRGADIKELPLSWADVVELLDVLQGSTIGFEPDAYPRPPVRSLDVVTGDPEPVRARMSKTASGGYELELPRGLTYFSSAETLYLLDDRRAWRCTSEFVSRAGDVLKWLLPCARPLAINKSDLPEFCRSALPLLAQATELEAPSELFELVPPAPSFSFRIGLEDGSVLCRASVSYGETRLGLYDAQRPGQPPRDLVAEYHAQDVAETYFHYVGGELRFDESDDELLYLLLTDGLRDLGELGEVELSEWLRAVSVRDSPQLRVKATVKSGLLDVSVDSSGMSTADLAAYLDSYRRKQRYVRLSSGDIVRIGENLRTLDSLAEGLGTDVAELAGGVGNLPQSRALFVDALLRKAEGVRLDRSAAFRSIVREFETFSDADIEMPAGLADVLRGYQVAGVRWLGTLERFGFGGILADDMGLGKTLQVIAHVLARKEALGAGDKGGASAAAPADTPRETTLVVAPASLVYNWCAEFARFAPTLDVEAVVGTKAARERLIARAGEHDVLVTSYDLMKRDVGAYAAQRFRRVVLDEAQYIKNAGTQAAKCAKCLCADERFALTGTPIENRLSELWSIFDFLMPGCLGSRDDFAKRFEGPVEHNDAEATHRLQCLVAPFILRRLKADVLADLPEKSESVVMAQMGGEQSKLYRANQDRVALQVQHRLPDEFKKEKLKILAELTKLRQICCDPRLYYDGYKGGSAKLDACAELVHSAVDAGHAVLVFSQFTSMLDLIGERLRSEKIGFLVLTGSTSKEERVRLVSAFQAGEEPVFLISLKAGGVGLNLTAADVVIHYDPWWNLAAQNQATDRAHRIGQERAVSVFKLIAKDTIEERIVAMQERKRDLAEAVLGGEALASSQLTRDDVLALLGASA